MCLYFWAMQNRFSVNDEIKWLVYIQFSYYVRAMHLVYYKMESALIGNFPNVHFTHRFRTIFRTNCIELNCEKISLNRLTLFFIAKFNLLFAHIYNIQCKVKLSMFVDLFSSILYMSNAQLFKHVFYQLLCSIFMEMFAIFFFLVDAHWN